MEITVINADKALYRKSIEIALKYTKMTKSKKTSKTLQKIDFGMEPKIATLLPTCL